MWNQLMSDKLSSSLWGAIFLQNMVLYWMFCANDFFFITSVSYPCYVYYWIGSACYWTLLWDMDAPSAVCTSFVWTSKQQPLETLIQQSVVYTCRYNRNALTVTRGCNKLVSCCCVSHSHSCRERSSNYGIQPLEMLCGSVVLHAAVLYSSCKLVL